MSAFDSLDDTFDITPTDKEVKPVKKQKVDLIISDKSNDREKDYQYARAQIYDLVEKMQEAVSGALEVAQESDHPRAYEVVMQGAKSTAETVEKLADLHKKMTDLEGDDVKVTQQNNVQNNVFVAGTTAELMKMLKEQKNK